VTFVITSDFKPTCLDERSFAFASTPKKFPLKPLSDNLILKPIFPEQKKGSIYLGFMNGQSQLLREVYPLKGIVVAVGNKIKELKPGDEVIFKRFGAQEINLDEVYYVLNHKDVIAKVE